MGGKTAPANGHAGANGAAHGIAYTALPSGDDRDAEAALPLPRAKPLSLLPLIALIFFDVSGGPFGTEDAVRAAGPLLVIAGFILLPIIWSLPEALVTAELATTFPENSGYVAWVTAAFGPFWGFQEGFWSWLSGVTDNSVYPVLILSNVQVFFPVLATGWPRAVFILSVSFLLSYLNYRGLSVVGNTVTVTTAFILVPFIIFTLISVPHIQPSNWLGMDLATVEWATFINVMFWNLNYWDSVSTLAGEVDNPSKTFPRALMVGVVVVVASYLLPTLAALGVVVDQGDWTLGYYAKVAQILPGGGNWLAVWIVLSAAASGVGQFQAEMSSDAYQIQGMAERGFLPKFLGRRSRHDTPVWGVLMSAVGVCGLSTFNFVEIVQLLNVVYALAEVLEFVAFIWLRFSAPGLARPYKVPLGKVGCILMLLPGMALCLVVLAMPIYQRDVRCCGWAGFAVVVGFLLYPLLRWMDRAGVCEFEPLHFDLDLGHGLDHPGKAHGTVGGVMHPRGHAGPYVDVAIVASSATGDGLLGGEEAHDAAGGLHTLSQPLLEPDELEAAEERLNSMLTHELSRPGSRAGSRRLSGDDDDDEEEEE